jgi:hypothetical protein
MTWDYLLRQNYLSVPPVILLGGHSVGDFVSIHPQWHIYQDLSLHATKHPFIDLESLHEFGTRHLLFVFYLFISVVESLFHKLLEASVDIRCSTFSA